MQGKACGTARSFLWQRYRNLWNSGVLLTVVPLAGSLLILERSTQHAVIHIQGGCSCARTEC